MAMSHSTGQPPSALHELKAISIAALRNMKQPGINFLVGFLGAMLLTFLVILTDRVQTWLSIEGLIQPQAALDRIVSMTGDEPLLMMLSLSIAAAAVSLLHPVFGPLTVVARIFYDGTMFMWGILVGVVVASTTIEPVSNRLAVSMGSATILMFMLIVAATVTTKPLLGTPAAIRTAIAVLGIFQLIGMLLFYPFTHSL